MGNMSLLMWVLRTNSGPLQEQPLFQPLASGFKELLRKGKSQIIQKQGHTFNNTEIGTDVSISYGGTLSKKEIGLLVITCLDPKLRLSFFHLILLCYEHLSD